MWTFEFEGESDDASLGGSEDFTPRHDGPLTNAIIRSRVREDGGWFDRAGPAVGVDADILFPFHSAATRVEEHVLISREVLDAEFFVAHGEVSWFESLHVGHSCSLDVASTPACIDEFPFAVVDTDGVPGVAGVVGWKGSAGFEGGVAIALAVAADDNTFKASVGGQGGEESGVAFADC